MRPDITIIIATFNSEKTLGLVLDAVRRQDYPQNQLEILVIDGGSTDNTCSLAVGHGGVVIINPEIEPVSAKFLGLRRARGRYLVFLDHDEVMQDSSSLRRKYEVFAKESDVYAVIGSGYDTPDPRNIVRDYTNEFGDPFSFFIYRLSKGSRFFIETIRDRYFITREYESYMVVDFTEMKVLPLIELVALGTMIDRDYFHLNFPEAFSNKDCIGHLFYFLVELSPRVAVTKDDALTHHSSESISLFLAKIRWRVKSNIYFLNQTGIAGFSGRIRFGSSLLGFKKYLFPLYAFSLIFPLLDACYLALTRRNVRYFLHVPLVLYTAGVIGYHLLLYSMGYRPIARSYDEKTKIKGVIS